MEGEELGSLKISPTVFRGTTSDERTQRWLDNLPRNGCYLLFGWYFGSGNRRSSDGASPTRFYRRSIGLEECNRLSPGLEIFLY